MTTPYNIYYGTIGNKLGVQYRFTRNCKDEEEAKKIAYVSVLSFFYKNEGKYGVPTYNQISKEAEITGVDIEKLYKEHIYDFCRWFAIPTSEDTISSKNLKY